jgi:hypothetical protein
MENPFFQSSSMMAKFLYGLPKVSSLYPLSPRRGERARVRGDQKKLLATGKIA